MTGFELAITTRRRPQQLARLLQSLADDEHLPHHVRRVIVVDNDSDGAARAVVESAALPVTVDYRVEPRPGYATARNAAVTARTAGSDLCFVDDDQVVTHGWARAMGEARSTFPETVIVGEVVREHHEWPMDEPQALPGDRLTPNLCKSGNTLFPALLWDTMGLRFDLRFDRVGSEDLDLMLRFDDRGGTARWWPAARCLEPADPGRAGLDLYCQQRQAQARRYAGMMRERREQRLRLLASGVVRTTTGSALALVTRGDLQRSARVSAATGRGLLRGLTSPLDLEGAGQRHDEGVQRQH